MAFCSLGPCLGGRCMSTVVTLFASAWMLLASEIPSATFQTNYLDARLLARESAKPLAVFIQSGAEGWDKISRDGRLDPQIKQQLTNNYVCLYIDRNDDAGKKLAASFEIESGLVI